MTRISGEQFAQSLTQLSEAVQSGDPRTCMQELQKFGQAVGADHVNRLVDSFESISGAEKNILKGILTGQAPPTLQGAFFAKDAIATELQQQLQKGMMEAQLGGMARMLMPQLPPMNSQGLSVLREVMCDRMADAFRQGAALNQKAAEIVNDPRLSGEFKSMALTTLSAAGQHLAQSITQMYPQIQQLDRMMGQDPLAQMFGQMGSAVGAHLPPGLRDAMGGGQGAGPLGDILGRVFSEPAVAQRLGQYLNQAAQSMGLPNFSSLIEQAGQALGKGGQAGLPSGLLGGLGEKLGQLAGMDLSRFLPKGVDWNNPGQAIQNLAKSAVDGFLFDKENGLGLEREYKGSWSKGGEWTRGWGDPGAQDIVKNFGIGYGQLGKTLWEGKFGGFQVGNVDARAEGAWGSAYAKGGMTFLEASARAFGDIDPETWSAMIGVEGQLLLAGADYSAGYSTPRLNIGGHQVGIDTNANLHAMVGAEGRLMAEIGLKDNPHIAIGGEAFAGARARLSGEAGLNVDGQTLAGVRGGVEGWAGIGAKAGIDAGYKDGTFSFDFDLGLALGIGFEVDFGFDVNVGAIADTLSDIGSTLWGGIEDVGEGIAGVAEDVGEGIVDVAEDVGGAIEDAAEAVGGAISDAAEAVGDAVSNFFSGW
jgi:hypothetical protein